MAEFDVEKFKKELDRWKNEPLKIGFIGESGSGKSSLINTLRDLEDGDEGAAETDVIECTNVPTSYPYPDNKNVELIDLPGIGTTDFPRKEYLKKIKYENYDFFLIISQSRFTEDDAFIANEIRQSGKKFTFVRSRVDMDLQKGTKEGRYESHHVMERIRNHIEEKLREKGVAANCTNIFLINCTSKELEFEDLRNHILDNLDEFKREVLILSSRCYSKGMIDKKREALEKRVWKAAAVGAATGALPLPGINTALNWFVIVHEVNEYLHQMGLDEESLKETATIFKIDVPHVTSHAKNTQFLRLLKDPDVQDLAGALAGNALIAVLFCVDSITDEASVFVPLVGSVIGSSVSFAITLGVLKLVLKWAVEDAKNVLDAAQNAAING